MSRLVWRKQLEIGVAMIDDDHKQMLDHLNDLGDAVNGDKQDLKKVAVTLLHLLEYTKEHFRREEGLMIAVNYPDVADHQRQHADVARAVHAVSVKFSSKPTIESASVVYELVRHWLIEHIIKVDMLIAPYVHTANAKRA